LTQQVPPPPQSKLRKGFLVVGMVLLILGFFFFYWASRVNWDYVTTYKETVDVGSPTIVSNYGFGNCYEYSVHSPITRMQSSDYLTVEYSSYEVPNPLYIYIVLFDETNPSNITALSHQYAILTYANHDSSKLVSVSLAIPSNDSSGPIPVRLTLNLHHDETPQWAYFGIGVVLCSLAIIPIFKSKRQAEIKSSLRQKQTIDHA
jgi:hypothetical protein